MEKSKRRVIGHIPEGWIKTLTRRELAERLGFHERSISRYILHHNLDSRRPGNKQHQIRCCASTTPRNEMCQNCLDYWRKYWKDYYNKNRERFWTGDKILAERRKRYKQSGER